MAGTTTTVRSLFDILSEEVACRSGILLTDSEMNGIAYDHDYDNLNVWYDILQEDPEHIGRIRLEDVEECLIMLRAGIGNLPDSRSPMDVMYQNTSSLNEIGVPVHSILSEILKVTEEGLFKVINEEAAREISKRVGVKQEMVNLVLLTYADMQSRSLFLFTDMKPELWDGAIPLTKLFKGESIPDDPELYLDQRFIDYLSARGEDIERIHWRNFERLCAEFFKRHGFTVELGPGTKDGGIDVRVWPHGSEGVGPALLLIQCKRHSSSNQVGVQWIKALWADVAFEHAGGGLLATTASVGRGGKRLAEARGWPLTFAEGKDVQKWAKSMWRYSWSRGIPAK